MAGSSGWNQPNWGSSAPAYGYYSYDPNGTIGGTVQIRLKWNPTNREPPAAVNLAISCHAMASSGGTATANNGFESKSGSGDVTNDGKYLVQKAGAREIILSYSPSVSGASNLPPGRSRTVLQVGLSAALDPRYARVKASAIPAQYYVKGDDFSAVSTLNDVLWARTIVRSRPYVYQGLLVKDPVEAVGANRREVRTCGLPEGYQDDFRSISRLLTNTFTGEVATQQISPESYTFTDDLSGTSVSETLPSFGNGWDVEPIGPISARGGMLTYLDGRLNHLDKEDYSEQVRLKYTWADGLKAIAEMQLIFRERFSNERLIQPETIHEGGAKTFAFPGSFASLDVVEWQPWEGGMARRVRWGEEQIAYKAGSTVVNVAAAALSLTNPEGAALAAMIGVGLSIGSPIEGEGDLTPDDPSTADTDLVKHEMNISTQLAQQLEGMSNEDRMRILKSRMQWKAQYIAEYAIDVFLRDEYGVQGYVGPAYRKKVRPVANPIASQAKKFIYEAN